MHFKIVGDSQTEPVWAFIFHYISFKEKAHDGVFGIQICKAISVFQQTADDVAKF